METALNQNPSKRCKHYAAALRAQSHKQPAAAASTYVFAARPYSMKKINKVMRMHNHHHRRVHHIKRVRTPASTANLASSADDIKGHLHQTAARAVGLESSAAQRGLTPLLQTGTA